MILASLQAEESAEAESAADTEEALPEVSDPPYSVGARATIQGHYIALDDDVSINLRILNNRLRIYWVDKDDLILEPLTTAGNVRFRGSTRGPTYLGMELLGGEAGLGSIGRPLLKPHIYNVILNLEKPDSEEFDTYAFRYTTKMSAIRETR